MKEKVEEIGTFRKNVLTSTAILCLTTPQTPLTQVPQLCERAGLGNEPRRMLSELSEIRVMDVVLPTRQGVEIRKRCISKPSEHQEILLDRLGLRLPSTIKQIEM